MTGQLWFLHLPKNAGTAFWGLVTRNYQRTVKLKHDGPFTNDELESVAEAEAVGGHFEYGTHEIGVAPRLVTILRHPVSRIQSFYYYIRAHPTHFDHELVAEMSFHEFVSSDLDHVSNQQVRRLGGSLDGAVENLATFEVVGVQEDMGAFVGRVADRFGWKHVDLRRRNVGRGRREPIADETRRVILERNSLDLALYETIR